jgi:hypothetical protein
MAEQAPGKVTRIPTGRRKPPGVPKPQVSVEVRAMLRE